MAQEPYPYPNTYGTITKRWLYTYPTSHLKHQTSEAEFPSWVSKTQNRMFNLFKFPEQFTADKNKLPWHFAGILKKKPSLRSTMIPMRSPTGIFYLYAHIFLWFCSLKNSLTYSNPYTEWKRSFQQNNLLYEAASEVSNSYAGSPTLTSPSLRKVIKRLFRGSSQFDKSFSCVLE